MAAPSAPAPTASQTAEIRALEKELTDEQIKQAQFAAVKTLVKLVALERKVYGDDARQVQNRKQALSGAYQVTGDYANALAIWHTGHEFTFDFLVNSEPPRQARAEDGEDVIQAPHRLVARIRVPPTAVFDIIRTINQNLTLYEQRFGQIRPPCSQSPLYPPEGPDDLPTEDS